MSRHAIGLLALAFALVACDHKKDSTSTTTAAVASGSAPSASSTATDEKTLAVGDAAPDITLPLQDGRNVKLASLAGKPVVVYFYPKDQTSGCTMEADNFRDKFEDLKKANVTVIGVSTQDAASHKAFIEKEKLPFDLAIDSDASIARAFGVPLKNNLHARQTFLIGKDGKVKKIWRDVQPKDHAVEVLQAAQS